MHKFVFVLLVGLLAASYCVYGGRVLPDIQEVLKVSGLGIEQTRELTDDERDAIRQISELYEADDRLYDREQALLKSVGSSMPNGIVKNQLRTQYNQHLLNLNTLGQLGVKLRNAVLQANQMSS